ncbi:MAG: hypothetical protein FJ144_05790 [Deltaproteobacteria bacterium]|nr:hypothetical protein [Deltaproteobacteria bacterium]
MSCRTHALVLVTLALAPVITGGVRRADASEIVVMMRDRVGRDSDLDAKPLTPEELARLQQSAGVTLRPVRLADDGAQVLALPAALDQGAARDILADLRGLHEVVYADDDLVTPLASDIPAGMVDRIVIRLDDRGSRDASDAGIAMPQETVRALSAVAGVPLFYERPVSGGAYALRLFQRLAGAEVARIAKRLAADSRVAYAEPAARGRFQAIPDDPLFAKQWDLLATPAGINAPAAWERTAGNPDVVVAVLDSGIVRDHPDLRGRTLQGWDFVSDVRRSSDWNGRDPDPGDPGDATAASECAAGDPSSESTWHGTHVAGMIGARANDGVGIAGVASGARLLPVRVGAKCGIDPIDLADAVRWASGAVVPGAHLADVPVANPQPARVLNLSMEFPGPCPRFLQDAITAATKAGALVVAAAGNAASPAERYYPANCAGVLAVGATDRSGGRTPYSNYGRVHVSAPGGSLAASPEEGVLSTWNTGKRAPAAHSFGFKEGTSMSAPLVAGVAALVLSLDPSLDPGAVHNLVADTARPFPVGTAADCVSDGPRSCGAGILDAAAAVAATPTRQGEG